MLRQVIERREYLLCKIINLFWEVQYPYEILDKVYITQTLHCFHWEDNTKNCAGFWGWTPCINIDLNKIIKNPWWWHQTIAELYASLASLICVSPTWPLHLLGFHFVFEAEENLDRFRQQAEYLKKWWSTLGIDLDLGSLCTVGVYP